MPEAARARRVVVSADTVVVCNGQILEKPSSDDHAKEMLRSLAGRQHSVFTAVTLLVAGSVPLPSTSCFHQEDSTAEQFLAEAQQQLHAVSREGATKTFVVETEVEFDTVSDETIAHYVASKEPMDKAGAYAIQGLGAQLVKAISGCYYNVVGLPLNRFCAELTQFLQLNFGNAGVASLHSEVAVEPDDRAHL